VTTPNTGIPEIPQGAIDVAAAINESLRYVDALLQPRVLDMDRTAPPGSPVDGQMHVVAGTGGTATGAWALHENDLAQYVEEGAFWQFYRAGVNVHLILNADDNGLYAFSSDSPGAWQPAVPGAYGAPIVTLSGTTYTLADLTPGAWHEFTSGSPVTLTIMNDADEPIALAAEFGLMAAGAGGLTIVSDDLAAILLPRGGTLELEQEDMAMLKRRAVNSYKLVGETVPA
jgi:Protein of unknown function (DUF2793)